ncbi:hypothetical protein GBA52_022731 [Prunus armeniaca]|nr:hypothetical protein GBA52_022731 [Prunus armeniaca]
MSKYNRSVWSGNHFEGTSCATICRPHALVRYTINVPMKVGQSGRGSGRLSKWSRVRVLMDAENFLERGFCICARQYLEVLGMSYA